MEQEGAPKNTPKRSKKKKRIPAHLKRQASSSPATEGFVSARPSAHQTPPKKRPQHSAHTFQKVQTKIPPSSSYVAPSVSQAKPPPVKSNTTAYVVWAVLGIAALLYLFSGSSRDDTPIRLVTPREPIVNPDGFDNLARASKRRIIRIVNHQKLIDLLQCPANKFFKYSAEAVDCIERTFDIFYPTIPFHSYSADALIRVEQNYKNLYQSSLKRARANCGDSGSKMSHFAVCKYFHEMQYRIIDAGYLTQDQYAYTFAFSRSSLSRFAWSLGRAYAFNKSTLHRFSSTKVAERLR